MLQMKAWLYMVHSSTCIRNRVTHGILKTHFYWKTPNINIAYSVEVSIADVWVFHESEELYLNYVIENKMSDQYLVVTYTIQNRLFSGKFGFIVANSRTAMFLGVIGPIGAR